MGRVGIPEPERVENQNVHALQPFQRLPGEPFAIGDVAEASHAETVRANLSVRHAQWQEYVVEDLHRPALAEGVHIQFGDERPARSAGTRVEDVGKAPPELPGYRFVHPGAHAGSVERREHSQVVYAVDVVRMRVRKPDRIHGGHLFGQKLQPQFGRRVDQEAPAAETEKRSVSHALVARVG